jgi:hypothetical protein
VATLLTACGQAGDAARLLGAVASGRHLANTFDYGRQVFAEVFDPALSATRAALDEAAFAQAWAVGEAVPLDKAISLAFEALEQLTKELAAEEGTSPALPA